jgi:zinc transport system substrate-binding protein
VVTFHKAWEYFADAIPLTLVGTIEPKPAITPSPAQVQQTIELMKRENVKVVICETYDDDKLAKYIAENAGAVEITLPDHVNGVPGTDTYVKLFLYDTDKLIEAAKTAGIQPK